MNPKLIVILNPKSGSSGEDFKAAIEKGLQSRGMEYEIRETTLEINGGQLAQDAVKEGATHLLACGGDGTVMSVVNGLGKIESKKAAEEAPDTTLSIIPGGTANLLAQALDIPTDTDEAIAVAVAGEDKVIDLGTLRRVSVRAGFRAGPDGTAGIAGQRPGEGKDSGAGPTRGP
jgi:diacylglycerol kinase family enzyme